VPDLYVDFESDRDEQCDFGYDRELRSFMSGFYTPSWMSGISGGGGSGTYTGGAGSSVMAVANPLDQLGGATPGSYQGWTGQLAGDGPTNTGAYTGWTSQMTGGGPFTYAGFGYGGTGSTPAATARSLVPGQSPQFYDSFFNPPSNAATAGLRWNPTAGWYSLQPKTQSATPNASGLPQTVGYNTTVNAPKPASLVAKTPMPAPWQQYQSAESQLAYDQVYPQIMANYGNMLNLAGNDAASLQQQNNQLTSQQVGNSMEQMIASGLGNSTMLPSLVNNAQSAGSIRGSNIAANAANQKLGVYGQENAFMQNAPPPIYSGEFGTNAKAPKNQTPIEAMGATLFGNLAGVDPSQLGHDEANIQNLQQTLAR
jgi:hypothetical protein